VDDAERLQSLLDHVAEPRLYARWRYYWGDHPRVYATPKLLEVFRNLADSFVENYCGLAVNTRLARLEVTGWGGDAPDPAQAVWDASRLPQYQDRLYRYGLVHGRAYLIADDDDGQQTLRINPATMAYAEPDPDTPFTVAWGGKAWEAGDGWRATVYHDGEVVRYLSTGQRQGDTGSYEVESREPYPFDRVPVVEVTPYGDGPPLLDQITPIQDRINKIGANKFVAAEFGAFRQRVFFTRQDVTPFDLRNAPDHAIILDPGDPDGQSRVQELNATDLANYDKAKDSEVDGLFTIATLPRHLRVNPGTPPSGEAIKADEGPFVEAIRDHQRSMAEALADAMRLFGELEAEPIWRDPEVHNEQAMAATVAEFVGAGVPWQKAVQMYAGWTEDDVAEAEAAASQPTGNAVGAALLNAFASPTLAPPAEVPEVPPAPPPA